MEFYAFIFICIDPNNNDLCAQQNKDELTYFLDAFFGQETEISTIFPICCLKIEWNEPPPSSPNMNNFSPNDRREPFRSYSQSFIQLRLFHFYSQLCAQNWNQDEIFSSALQQLSLSLCVSRSLVLKVAKYLVTSTKLIENVGAAISKKAPSLHLFFSPSLTLSLSVRLDIVLTC